MSEEKKKVNDELDKFLEYCKKENECNRGQYELPGGNMTDQGWTVVSHWIRKYRNLQSSNKSGDKDE